MQSWQTKIQQKLTGYFKVYCSRWQYTFSLSPIYFEHWYSNINIVLSGFDCLYDLLLLPISKYNIASIKTLFLWYGFIKWIKPYII